MKKTRIDFEEIQPGELIEVVHVADGVKTVETGIAFEYDGDYVSGYGSWFTSEAGLLVLEDDANKIYRVDVTEVAFDDIRAGDLLRVTTVRGPYTQIVEVSAGEFIDNEVAPYWTSSFGGVLAWKNPSHVDGQKIEILERGE